MKDSKRTPLEGARLIHGQGIPAVGEAPTGNTPFAPSSKEHEKGIRAAADANAAAAVQEFRNFGRRAQ
jgi:hypothetical protein